MGTLGHTLARWEDPALLELTMAAQRCVLEFEGRIELRLEPDGDLGHIGDWGAKLVGTTVRIAGLLHLAKHPSDGWHQLVEEKTVIDAIKIAEYYQSHALAAFDLMQEDTLVQHAEYLLDVIRRLQRETVSQRDLFNAVSRSRFRRSADLLPALGLVEDHGYVHPIDAPPSGRPGRPSSRRWEVHPEPPHKPLMPHNHRFCGLCDLCGSDAALPGGWTAS